MDRLDTGTAGATGNLRVVFDHRIFINQKHGGISRTYARLAEYLPDYGVTPKIIAPLYQSDYLGDLPAGVVWGRHMEPTPRRIRAGIILNEIMARPLAAMFDAHIVHETYHNPRRVAPRSARIVTSVYDMIHEIFDIPAVAGLTHCLDMQLARSERIICNSESTKRDLLRYYPEVEDKTEVVLLGFDAAAAEPVGPESPMHPKPYILYVGMRRIGYKNFRGLVAAYAASARLQAEFDLVAVGGGEFTPDENQIIADSGLTGKVFQRGASDVTLWSFYRQAAVFVFPSLYEGFGIPPLEAMAASCPVVTMNVSAMPEVCGEAVEYASPDAIESLTLAMESVLFSPARADRLRVAGRERMRHFSWHRCAEQTAAVYRGMM